MKKEETKEPEASAPDLKALLAKQEQAEMEACMREINEALKAHGCELVPVVHIVAGQVSTEIAIRKTK